MDAAPIAAVLLTLVLWWAANLVWEFLNRQRCGARLGSGLGRCRRLVDRRADERCGLHTGLPSRRWP